jgi:hypothetical protein
MLEMGFRKDHAELALAETGNVGVEVCAHTLPCAHDQGSLAGIGDMLARAAVQPMVVFSTLLRLIKSCFRQVTPTTLTSDNPFGSLPSQRLAERLGLLRLSYDFAVYLCSAEGRDHLYILMRSHEQAIDARRAWTSHVIRPCRWRRSGCLHARKTSWTGTCTAARPAARSRSPRTASLRRAGSASRWARTSKSCS